MAANGPPDEILQLIIRFTASIADLPLSIEQPRKTTTLSLKGLIRQHLPRTLSSNRLRLIHAGKVLSDTAPLSSSLNLNNASTRQVPPPPPNKGKGKEPVRGESGDTGPPPPRIYIHCSIGDALTTAELSTEAREATELEEKLSRSLTSRRQSSTGTLAEAASGWLRASGLPGFTPTAPTGTGAAVGGGNNASTTTPAPRGFDRLTSTGFTQSDIASLRNTFRAHLAHTHTPDTMPHGDALLALEDRWLDSSANEDGSGAGIGGGGSGGGGFDDDAEGSALDDMFWGNVFGFFWPIGAIVWGFREEGVWTRRRAIAVFTGLCVNLVFGFARLST